MGGAVEGVEVAVAVAVPGLVVLCGDLVVVVGYCCGGGGGGDTSAVVSDDGGRGGCACGRVGD